VSRRGRARAVGVGGVETKKAEITFVVINLVFGLISVGLIPIGAGWDEEKHLIRVWDMSIFPRKPIDVYLPNALPRRDLPFPRIFSNYSYRRFLILGPMPPEFYLNNLGASIGSLGYITEGFGTFSVYSPPLLLPQAVALGYYGRVLELPALPVYFIVRAVGLFSYLVLGWFSIRAIPYGKWPLAVLLSAPAMLFHAATINVDPISNGFSILFLSATLAVAQREELEWKEWRILLFLFFLLFWAKVNSVFLGLLPFLLIRPSKFKMRSGYALLVVAVLALGVIELVGWNLAAYSKFSAAPEGTDPVEQLKGIAGHPLEFLDLAWNNLVSNSLDYLETWVAKYGHSYWIVPGPTYVFFSLALISALLIKTDEPVPSRRVRSILLLLFILGWLATVGSLYVAYNPVGHDQIDGVKGHYFAPVVPLLILALVGLAGKARIEVPEWMAPLFGTLALFCFTAGIYLSYHVPCGYTYYRPGVCLEPIYKNWAPGAYYSPPLSDQLSLTQEIVAECEGMTELRVWLDASAAAPEGTTQIVFQNRFSGMLLADYLASNLDLPAGGWVSIPFEPDWESQGGSFLLKITSHNDSGNGIRVGYTPPAQFLDGWLYENRLPTDSDVLFRLGCLTGLEKLRRSFPGGPSPAQAP